MTESELEDQFLRLCDRFAIPRPAVGVTVEGLKVDFLWRHERLVAETDGWRWHGARGARERDHRRDITLQLRGFRVVRFSFRRILTQPAAVAADLARLLRS
jgi:very-short-patch-repair endonuclease